MKKLFVLLVVLSNLLNAQQTITGTSPIGYSVSLYAATPATASNVPLTSGTNVTWNCAGLISAQAFTIDYAAPNTYTYFALYPTSNYHLNGVTSTGTIVNEFYILNNDSCVKLGQRIPGQPYEIYSDPEMTNKFPFSYGNSITNTYAKTNYLANGTISSTQTGSTTISYEGYGTLILPSSTYTNVALIKNIRTNSIGPTTTSYEWVKFPSGERLMTQNNKSGISVNFVGSLPTSIKNISDENRVCLLQNFNNNSFIIQSKISINKLKVFNVEGIEQPYDILNKQGDSIEIKPQQNIGLLIFEIMFEDGKLMRNKVVLNY